MNTDNSYTKINGKWVPKSSLQRPAGPAPQPPQRSRTLGSSGASSTPVDIPPPATQQQKSQTLPPPATPQQQAPTPTGNPGQGGTLECDYEKLKSTYNDFAEKHNGSIGLYSDRGDVVSNVNKLFGNDLDNESKKQWTTKAEALENINNGNLLSVLGEKCKLYLGQYIKNLEDSNYTPENVQAWLGRMIDIGDGISRALQAPAYQSSLSINDIKSRCNRFFETHSAFIKKCEGNGIDVKKIVNSLPTNFSEEYKKLWSDYVLPVLEQENATDEVNTEILFKLCLNYVPGDYSKKEKNLFNVNAMLDTMEEIQKKLDAELENVEGRFNAALKNYNEFVAAHNKFLGNSKEAVDIAIDIIETKYKDVVVKGTWATESEEFGKSKHKDGINALFNLCSKYFTKDYLKKIDRGHGLAAIDALLNDMKLIQNELNDNVKMHGQSSPPPKEQQAEQQAETPEDLPPTFEQSMSDDDTKKTVDAVEMCKKQLESMINKFNEFVKSINEEGKLKLISYNFAVGSVLGKANAMWQIKYDESGKAVPYTQSIGVSLAGVGQLEDLYGCSYYWEIVGNSLCEFLPFDQQKKYKDAVSKAREKFTKAKTKDKQVKAMEIQRALARKIFVYMERVKETILDNIEKDSQVKPDEQVMLNKYIEADKEIDLKKIGKTSNEKVKTSFQKAAQEFINNGNMKSFSDIEIKNIDGHFGTSKGITRKFKAALTATLKTDKLKLYASKDISEEGEKLAHVAMGVLLISTAYVGEPADIVSACDGLKAGGLKGGTDKDFIGCGTKIRKAIKKGAQGGLKGDDLIKFVKSKAQRELSYFIDTDKLKDIMNKFHKGFFKRLFSRKNKK